MSNIERSYDGKLTLWAPFLALEDVRTDEADVAVVSEENYIRLYDQLAGAVRVLEAIHKLGGVCDEYETCEHRACQHSYAAWALADAYLRGGQ